MGRARRGEARRPTADTTAGPAAPRRATAAEARPRPCQVHADPPATPASVLRSRPWLLYGLAALLTAMAASAALRGGRVLLTWDEPIQRWVEAHRTPALDRVFLDFTWCGATVTVLVLGCLAAAATWRRCRAVGTVLLVAALARPLLEFVLKVSIDRPRPHLHRLVGATGSSFPSGHTLAAVALWGLLPLVVSLYTRRRGLWWASVVVSAVMVLGVAASRVYLGVHWFSDVVGSLVVGTFFLFGLEAVLARQHARYPCDLLAPHASSAVTGRWSDSEAKGASSAAPGPGTSAETTSTPADTYT